MTTSVYTINKGINKPIEFKGLKAQYIGYLAAGLIGLLILFAALYISGVNTFVCLFMLRSRYRSVYSCLQTQSQIWTAWDDEDNCQKKYSRHN